MRILVTGGAGYIGSVTSNALIKAGHEVTVLDNLSTGRRSLINPAAKFIDCDLCNLSEVRSRVKEHYEAVFHFASKTLVGESVLKPFLYLRDNYVSACNILEVMLELKINKFILSSTANLFGEPKEDFISENETIIPGSPYGDSKYFIEKTLAWLNQYHGMQFACLRYFNASGSDGEYGELHDPETHLIPLILDVAIGKRKEILVFGNDYPTADGTCVRDYVHVCDLASAHMLALKNLTDKPLYYNLGNGSGYSVMDVIKSVEKITGKNINYKITDRRAGDPAVLVADSSKIRKELGWKPEFPEIDQIVASAWEFHQKNNLVETTCKLQG